VGTAETAPVKSTLATLLILGAACTPPPTQRDEATSTDGGDEATSTGGGNEPAVSVSETCRALGPDPATVTTFYQDNPTYLDAQGPILETAAPEQVGMSASQLEVAAARIAAEPFTWSLIVLRHERVVLERYFNGASAQSSNNVHSSSKSMLGALVGTAIDAGLLGLDQPVAEIIPSHFEGLDQAKHAITVRHLLTMTAGLRWTEDVSEYELQQQADWARAYLALPLDHEPGTTFEYSTGASHLLGIALAHATGESLCDYAHGALFNPLSVTAEHWGRDPKGYYAGGYNLYLTARELARFGQLIVGDGQAVVPSKWVASSIDWHADGGDGYGYGLLWWLWRPDELEVAVAWGFGGQLIYMIPEHDLVVVVTTNTHDYEPDYEAHEVVLEDVVGAITDN
jgi:CubicO group peptidase (beta-lactamase class C family)